MPIRLRPGKTMCLTRRAMNSSILWLIGRD